MGIGTPDVSVAVGFFPTAALITAANLLSRSRARDRVDRHASPVILSIYLIAACDRRKCSALPRACRWSRRYQSSKITSILMSFSL
ncbi:hypothetical protein LX32DRAFT_282400 [Colletotrichum zoysiae]|uniref:Uncharacterized protein n=1 Tax=Colletotrichum zoysiae TaxID=1216348 RepID=A0AAD9H2E3_9PEZI|nr:hypothetical protein LX32DRAFT_282400 [Colletotrichum zoysiae]